jgi:hypothetical protein
MLDSQQLKVMQRWLREVISHHLYGAWRYGYSILNLTVPQVTSDVGSLGNCHRLKFYPIAPRLLCLVERRVSTALRFFDVFSRAVLCHTNRGR